MEGKPKIGNWIDILPLEINLLVIKPIIDLAKKQSNNEVRRVYKVLRRINHSFEALMSPLLLQEHANYLEDTLKKMPELKENKSLHDQIKAIHKKAEEKQNAINALWAAQSTLKPEQFLQILKGISSLSSEFWVLGEVTKQLHAYKQQQKREELLYDPYGTRDFWHPPELYANQLGRMERSTDDYRKDLEPPGPVPTIPHIVQPFSTSPFRPAPDAGRPSGVWGEPTPDSETPLGGQSHIPGLTPPVPNPTSPFGTALPAPNPFNPRSSHGVGGLGTMMPRFG